MPSIEEIQIEAVPDCPACGRRGKPLYENLHDHTFGSQGTWALSRCASCGQVWLNPRPTERDIGKVYENYYTHEVAATVGSMFHEHFKSSAVSRRLVQGLSAAMHRVQDAVLAVRFGYTELRTGSMQPLVASTLGLLPGVARGAALQVMGLKAEERGDLLDVGCGNGLFLARMKRLGWRTVGVETDAAAAEIARENFGLDVKEGRLANVGLPEASFDVVTLSHVIEHVHSPGDLVLECRRLLKPNGKLIILTPNTAGLGHRIFRRSWRGLEPPRHIQCFSPQTLRACVDHTGMRIERVTTESRIMRYIWYTSMSIRRAQSGGGRSNTAFDYVASFVMRFVESVALYVVRDAGEEIMLMATKPAS